MHGCSEKCKPSHALAGIRSEAQKWKKNLGGQKGVRKIQKEVVLLSNKYHLKHFKKKKKVSLKSFC